MKANIFASFVLLVLCILGSGTSALGQQPTQTEKEKLVMKFRQLTGADKVNLRLNVEFEETKTDFLSIVDSEPELSDAQKVELRKAALEAYSRLDAQLKAYLNDQAKMTEFSKAAVFGVYDKAFTEAELQELITFYSKPVGQKALQFLPTLSSQVQNAFQSLLIPKLQEFIGPIIKTEGDGLKKLVQETKTKRP